MRIAVVLLFLVGLLGYPGRSQVVIHQKDASNEKIYLQSFSINGYQKIDSAVFIAGKLIFPIRSSYLPGIYLAGNGTSTIEFILDEPMVEMEIHGGFLQDNMRIVYSDENILFQKYKRLRDKSYLQLDLLNSVILNYDSTSSFYRVTMNEFKATQDNFFRWIDSVTTLLPGSFLVHYIRADIKPEIIPGLSLNAQKEFFRKHWFDEIDWTDNSMMNSDVLTRKITAYLGLYSNPGFKKAELENAFMEAVDVIIPSASQNPFMKDFTIKYLLRGFERYGFDEVILHIATLYSPEQCENEQQSETLARLEKYKQMAPGKIAPDIKMQDADGNKFVLSDVKSRKLVIFWASWCPHCRELIPELIKWSNLSGNKGIEIIPVSLDEDRSALTKAVIELNIPWKVLVDYRKWSCPAVVDYNIYATPTMLLLDKDNRILAKPMNIRELQSAIIK